MQIFNCTMKAQDLLTNEILPRLCYVQKKGIKTNTSL